MKRLAKCIILICVIAMMAVLPVFGATETFTGEEAEFWTNHAVVIGKVEAVTEKGSEVEIRVDLKAVIATDFMVPDDMLIKYVRARNSPLAGTTFEKGTLAMLCVELRGGEWFLPASYLTVFENRIAATRVSSTRDVVVERHVTAIKKARESSRRKSALKQIEQAEKKDKK